MPPRRRQSKEESSSDPSESTSSSESSSSSEEEPKLARRKTAVKRVKQTRMPSEDLGGDSTSYKGLQQNRGNRPEQRRRNQATPPFQDEGRPLQQFSGPNQSRRSRAPQSEMPVFADQDDREVEFLTSPRAGFTHQSRQLGGMDRRIRSCDLDEVDSRLHGATAYVDGKNDWEMGSRDSYRTQKQSREGGSHGPGKGPVNVIESQTPVPTINPDDAPDISDERFAAAIEESKRQAMEDEKRRQEAHYSDDYHNLKRALEESKSTANTQIGRLQREVNELIDPQVLRASKAAAKIEEKRRRQRETEERRARAEEAEAIRQSKLEHQARVEQEAKTLEAERSFGSGITAQQGHHRQANSSLSALPAMQIHRLRTQSMSDDYSRVTLASVEPAYPLSSSPQRSTSTTTYKPRTQRISRVSVLQNSDELDTPVVVEGKGKEHEKPVSVLDDNKYWIPDNWAITGRQRKEAKDKRKAAMRKAKEDSLRNREDAQLTMAMAASLQDNPIEERTIDDQAEDNPPPIYPRIFAHPRKLDPLKWMSDNGGGYLPGFLKRITSEDLELMRIHALNVEKEKVNAGGLAQKASEAKVKMECKEEAEVEDTLGEMMQETGRTRAVARQQPVQSPGGFRDRFESFNNQMSSKRKKKKEYPGQASSTGIASSSRHT